MNSENVGRRGRPWRTLLQRVLDEEDLCGWCNREVDKTLHGRHPWGPTVDHIDNDRTNNERTNLQLMHRRCNLEKENQRRARAVALVEGRPVPTTQVSASGLHTSRAWFA